jgi:hypothetical protein
VDGRWAAVSLGKCLTGYATVSFPRTLFQVISLLGETHFIGLFHIFLYSYGKETEVQDESEWDRTNQSRCPLYRKDQVNTELCR